MFGLFRITFLGSIILILYLAAWGVIYRIPAAPDLIVDVRESRDIKPYYVSICAGLASNPHGFPGHAFIGWTDKSACEKIETIPTAGYCPKFAKDQGPSLVRSVTGIMLRCTGTAGNARNLNRLIVVCSQADYIRTQRICEEWSCSDFQVGKRDCVTLANEVTSALKLHTPPTAFKYPQDYVTALKKLNQLN